MVITEDPQTDKYAKNACAQVDNLVINLAQLVISMRELMV
jgi:hypothetical protein